MNRRTGESRRPPSRLGNPDYSYVAGYGDGYAKGFETGRAQALTSLKEAISRATEAEREQETEPEPEPEPGADRDHAADLGHDDIERPAPIREREPELEA